VTTPHTPGALAQRWPPKKKKTIEGLTHVPFGRWSQTNGVPSGLCAVPHATAGAAGNTHPPPVSGTDCDIRSGRAKPNPLRAPQSMTTPENGLVATTRRSGRPSPWRPHLDLIFRAHRLCRAKISATSARRGALGRASASQASEPRGRPGKIRRRCSFQLLNCFVALWRGAPQPKRDRQVGGAWAARSFSASSSGALALTMFRMPDLEPCARAWGRKNRLKRASLRRRPLVLAARAAVR